jgi:hypothetical protein
MNRAIGVPDKEAGLLSFAKTPHQARHLCMLLISHTLLILAMHRGRRPKTPAELVN